MRKGFLIVLAVALVAVMAAPAVAGMDAAGFVRVKGYMSNFKNGASQAEIKKDPQTASYVDQRFRGRFSFGEENVKAVWFVETDFGAFGDTAGAATTGGVSRNSGGALGGDRINLETKNIFVWFKLPNTSLDFTVGLQGQADGFAGLIFNSDFAGIFVNGKMEPLSYTLGWAKLYENNNLKSDDMTLYVAAAKLSPMKDTTLGLNFYFLRDDTQKLAATLPFDTGGTPTGALPFGFHIGSGGDLNTKEIYTLGLNGSTAAGPATLSGFFLYQFGDVDFLAPADPDGKIAGFAGDLRADLNVGPGKLFIEGLYVSGGDGSGTKYKSIMTLADLNASPGGNSFFARTDMMILLVNADDINTSTALVGAAGTPVGNGWSTSPGNGGRGILHIAAGFSMKLADKLTGKLGAGYLAATKMLIEDQDGAAAPFAGFSTTKKGKSMGTEVNANVNYNILKGLDFGLYGGYAWLGDFYKSSAAGAVDPDDVYDVHFRLNYAF